MTLRRLYTVSIVLVFTACGGSPTQPSIPPASSLPGPNLPTPQLSVRIDSRGSAVAIVGLSQVTFDARGTPGDKLRYELQFGDGESASTPVSTHVYPTAGTFTATLTVTDAAGRRASTSALVTVKAVQGTWFHSDYNERSKRPEVHRLTVVAQQGLTLRGVYSSLGAADQAFTGALSGERDVRLVLDDQSVQFAGSVPGEILSEWPLTISGGSAGGQTLPFQPVIGDLVGPPPTAHLSVRFEGGYAIMGLTPISFDASGSSGEQLSYIIEFGDGEYTRERSAIQAVNAAGPLTARVTVTDRFGRFEAASQRLGNVESLRDCFLCQWVSHFRNHRTGRDEFRSLTFNLHEGRSVTGRYRHPEGSYSQFSGTLDGHWGIEMMLDGGGIVFTGRIVLESWYRRMPVVARGGSADGMILEFFWDDGPG